MKGWEAESSEGKLMAQWILVGLQRWTEKKRREKREKRKKNESSHDRCCREIGIAG